MARQPFANYRFVEETVFSQRIIYYVDQQI